ncbi:HTH lacI-type domain-containing protein [Ruminococcaceae bacterium BL-6]|jgi:LacI family transcriptional regulator|nr:HTH lacI-type domain-containing protein [Ruminococcaceae bacterium BL-6]HBC27776.1 hypothetical protein [Oscillospiraceae bacterium]
MKPGKPKKSTIYDIASKTGFSASTVSRVLSGSTYPVHEQTRRKILECAQELHYVRSAQRARFGFRDLEIGVILPNISNPFYPQIAMGILSEAKKYNCNVFFCDSFRSEENQREYIRSLLRKKIRGIIISPLFKHFSELELLRKKGVEIVVVDQEIEGISCSQVQFDTVKGGILAVDYLASMGHREIAFLGAPLTRISRREALEGFKIGMMKNGLPVREENVILSDIEEEIGGSYEFENGRILAERFMKLQNRPTAIMAVNDMTAIGIMQWLMLEGRVSIPGQVSIIGFDNVYLAKMVTPPLTTIQQPAYETGKLALKLLMDRINGGGSDVYSISLEPELIIRGTVRDLNNKIEYWR